ncbi:hypothetical protein [Kitasatospora sp. NPDC086791]|uniref:hypothetical protein n=1 Tax=Kitasatospora sp. NPDC086791 TaxID=3155178 RepID=UPI0034399BDF
MSREVRRVPLDFDWPIGKVWHGYLMPDTLYGNECPDCRRGYSEHAEHLYGQWYGKAPFNPEGTGSTLLRPDTPAVRAFAERNVEQAPDYYGTGETAIVREAQRLADLFNRQWGHHLSQQDVDALVAEDRLRELTHTWSYEHGWRPIEPLVIPTAAQVNEWSLRGMGHDSINASVVIRARCARDGVSDTCTRCQGHGSVEAYPGQRAEAEAWQPAEPPVGDGWQLWETVTEGSPKSPVFATADDLATWMSDPARGTDWVPGHVAAQFIEVGWAPTSASSAGTGMVLGVEYIGTQEQQ